MRCREPLLLSQEMFRLVSASLVVSQLASLPPCASQESAACVVVSGGAEAEVGPAGERPVRSG